jgi:hypothetical protein
MRNFIFKAKPLLVAIAILAIGVFANRIMSSGDEPDALALQPISITSLSPSSNQVDIEFNHAPDGPQVMVRVDSAGGGDVKTITEALERVQSGEIAIASGRHSVSNLTIPPGVILSGGYDPQTWTFSPNNHVTTLVPEDPKDNSALIKLTSGSAIYAVVIDGADTAIDMAGDGVIVQGVGITHSRIGILARASARGVINYATLAHNKTGIILEKDTEVSVQNSIFNKNTLGVTQL